MMICCAHASTKRFGFDRNHNPRVRCLTCGKTWTVRQPKLLGEMRVPVESAKLVLNLLTQGMSIRATERTTGINRNTICKLLVFFGDACRAFMDKQMRGLTLTHLELDEQWTYVGCKESRISLTERGLVHDQGDVYLWTAVDQKTKLMPCFLVGKRSADNARRFAMDVASRLVFPKPSSSDAREFKPVTYKPIVQISTDAFWGYREAIDLAFGAHCKYGQITKEYRSARMVYTPSEMVSVKRRPIRGLSDREARSITTSHVERLNGTQRVFLKRLNRLTLCFSKKLRNLEAAFAMFAAYYNWCWQTRKPGKSGQKRGTAAMMAGLAGHVWSFDELFDTILNRNPQHQ